MSPATFKGKNYKQK